MKSGRPRTSLEERFWPKVAKSDDCWEWQGSTQPNGYGKIRPGGRASHIGAHRAAWLVTHGPIPEGMFVCHACDNPRCVRPDHLFLGTPSENQADMVAKDRKAKAGPKGEAHPRAKLTEADVKRMRLLKGSGWRNMDLAVQFGVSRSVVSLIVNGKLWTHIPVG